MEKGEGEEGERCGVAKGEAREEEGACSRRRGGEKGRKGRKEEGRGKKKEKRKRMVRVPRG